MAKHARKLGVRFKDRVEIIDLLKDGERVCGAIGFGMIDGECVIAQAGAVVLANGNQCYKLMPRWASAGGEGIAAAYRAGAAMRGAEFGNFINWVFADTKEVWQFEIFGPGAGEKGAVWAAKRIPPGEVGVSANHSRITTLDNDPNFSMFSKNVHDVAEKNGWWKKGDPFVFHRAYGGTGFPNRREWRVLSLLAPSLKLDPWAVEQPFSVKPDKKVSVRDLIRMHRDTYEGTPFEQNSSPLAGPFGTPNRWSLSQDFKPAPGYSPTERMIAVQQCSYVVVLQARANMPAWFGSLAWFAPDDAKTSVFSPLYAGNLKVPAAYETGRRDKYDRNSAYWASNFINNWANLNWNAMIQDVRAKQAEIEDKLFADQPAIEKMALEMYATNPDHARQFISDSISCGRP